MADSVAHTANAQSPKRRLRRPARLETAHGKAGSRRLPDWAPWAVLGGVLVLGAVGSSLVRAAAVSAHAGAEGRELVRAAPALPTSAPNAAASARAQASGAAAKDEARISVLHLVVTHAESMMGRSLKITRTREQAQERAAEALARARKGENFAKLVREYSEEPRTDETDGELKNFGRGDAIPSFAEAAFKLGVGELSEVVDTPFGYMVILRTS